VVKSANVFRMTLHQDPGSRGVPKRTFGGCRDESTWPALCLVGMFPIDEGGDE